MLYDALEFKLFNRVDLYATNLLASLGDISFADQVYYVEDCLVQLMIHLNSIKNKVFKVQLPTSLLKYVRSLRFEEYVDSDNKSPDFRKAIIENNAECIFSC